MLRISSHDTLLANAALASSWNGVSERPAKARRVRFAESPHQASVHAQKTETCEHDRHQQASDPTVTGNCDLSDAADMCHDIFQRSKSPPNHHQNGYVGYLRSENNLNHHLTNAQDRDSIAIQSLPSLPATLASAVQPHTMNSISINTQLRLALHLSQAVLQYHSAQFWRQTWSLSDLSYFPINEKDLSASLETLHISTKLTPKANVVALQTALSDTLTPPADDDVLLHCGIRNITLHCLGVALLQIGRWECVFNPADVVQVRKAAGRPSRMGPKYDRLIARCLYCDFGYGADLGARELQAALYGSLVRELEGMVGVLR